MKFCGRNRLQNERGALMKRTFGRFMSLLLVLAMVLAMVPAVLAAPYGTPAKNYVMDMGVGDEIRFPRAEDTEAATAIASAASAASVTWSVSGYSSWSSGTTTTLATINIKSGKYTILTAKGATGSTPVVLTAAVVNGTGSAAKTTYYDWTITISQWGLTLSTKTLNLVKGSGEDSGNAQEQELVATVTGPTALEANNMKGGFDAANLCFDSNNNAVIKDNGKVITATNKLKIRILDPNYKVSVSANSTTTNGVVWAKLTYQHYYVDNSGTQKIEQKDIITNCDVYVTDAASGTLKILKGSEDVTGSIVNTTTSAKTITLTASVNSVTTGGYAWESSDKTVADFANQASGTLTIKAEGTTTINVQSLVDKNITASCTVHVSDAVATIESIGYADTTIKALEADGKKFTNDSPVITNYTVNEITLVANVSDPAKVGDVEWKITKNPSYATITKQTNGTAKLTAKYSGEVTVSASLSNANGQTSTQTKTIQIWTAKAYIKQEKPSLSFTASTAMNAVRELEGKTVTVTLDGSRTKVSLPVKNVKIDGSGSGIQITADINGSDSKKLTVYYPKPDTSVTDEETKASGTISYSLSSDSDILFYEQPVSSAIYKVTDTFEPLYTYFKVTKSGYYITNVSWYDVLSHSKLQEESYDDKDNKTILSSTFNLKENGNINGPGEYTYQCVVTAENASKNTITGISNGATVKISGDYIVDITVPKTTINVGDSIEIYGVAQTYNPSSGKYVNVTAAHTVTWTMNESSLASLSKTSTFNTANAASVGKTTLTAKSGGKLTLTAKVELGNNTYTGTKTITIEIPTADTVRLTLGENDSYVLLDGSKLAAAVKDVCKTTPSTFVFKSPANGTLYTTSSLSNTASTSTKYSASEVSKMAYRPTRTTGTHEIEYTAYDGSAQIATGKVLVMTSASTVKYFISANEKQQMVVSDFQSVYGTGLSSVTFSSNTDSRGGLYKGSTTSSGKVGSETYSVSSGTNLLKNVYFIADSTVSKYSVTIPFTANGSSGQMSGQLVVYVNDTHTLSSTGATFRSMGIAAELAPDNATGSTYITIDRVVGGKLYSSYTSIKRCTALTSKDLGSTKFYFTGSNSLDNLYVLPMADSKSVDVTYTIDGITKGTLSFKVNQQTASNQFTDVVANFSWAANSVDFMYTNEIIKGNSSTNPRIFGPRAMMTRAMLVTVLYRAAGEPTVAGITNKFTDNKEGKYYYNAVLWASNMGIVNGSTATTFEPNGNITREQIAAILYRYAGSPTVTGSLSGYPDQAQVSSFAVSAMQWAVSNGIINGVNDGSKTTLSAKGNATRAQVAVMLHRFLTFD